MWRGTHWDKENLKAGEESGTTDISQAGGSRVTIKRMENLADLRREPIQT